jgi:hypothetical protein
MTKSLSITVSDIWTWRSHVQTWARPKSACSLAYGLLSEHERLIRRKNLIMFEQAFYMFGCHDAETIFQVYFKAFMLILLHISEVKFSRTFKRSWESFVVYQVLDFIRNLGCQQRSHFMCWSSWSLRSNHNAIARLFVINEVYRWVGKESTRNLAGEELKPTEEGEWGAICPRSLSITGL